MMLVPDAGAEWLEADGQGGFASGTVGGLRTRRYHALLLTAEADGTRFVLVNGADFVVETDAGRFPLVSQAYAGGNLHPAAGATLVDFATHEEPGHIAGLPGAKLYPGPKFTYALGDGTRVELGLFVAHGTAAVFVWARLVSLGDKGKSARLVVRPFMSGRDYHSLMHENPAFNFQPERLAGDKALLFRPYGETVPGIVAVSNGSYAQQPFWYRGFYYAEEEARGLDCEEDLASPGEFTFDLMREPAALIFARAGDAALSSQVLSDAPAWLADAAVKERARRDALGSPLRRAADAYVIDRAGGKTIIAGYPWFTDWGRDTFIALRGLCLATGRLDDARAILLRWAGAVSQGMLPNRFPDRGAPPEYNSVDAALWFAVATYEYLEVATGAKAPPAADRARLVTAIEAILAGHAAGSRHGIHVDDDGLLAAGAPGVQLTWMDAKIGDWVVTPRIGKPVEIEALWLNALYVGATLETKSAARWRDLFCRAEASFVAKFWNESTRYLNDVVDVDHDRGTVDARLRPNQIFAVGGLPIAVCDGKRARAVVDAVEASLSTPMGLRTLAPDDPAYCGRYGGTMRARDAAYHQGTVWPWLVGAFVDAWVSVHGADAAARKEAERRFIAPLLRHVGVAGLGHVSEVADGDPPYTPGGCPFQAWSVGELLRAVTTVSAVGESRMPKTARVR